ncbi:MAG: hypothetical protein IJU45_04420 [Clostridia bacterium]|nr:hypothetical protein [Clostridia bacterium]
MKPKTKALIIAAAVLIAAAAAVFVFNKISIKKENAVEAEYLKKNLPPYSSVEIISDFAQKDNNTLTAFKEAVRSGADIVTLDLCFNSDNDPVICSSYNKITDSSLPLSELFETMNTDEYKDIRLNLRLQHLGSTDTFNTLAAENNMSGRVIVSGIDKERYGIIQGDKIAANIYYYYTPQKDCEKSAEEIKQIVSQYDIEGVIIEYKNITDELIETLNNAGISYIISGVNKKSEMYRAIDLGIGLIQTKNTSQLSEIYNKWKDATVNNIDDEIDKRLQNNP